MTAADLTKEAREGAVRQHAAVMAALEDETFMAAVAKGLAEMRAGDPGKTFAQIHSEHGLKGALS